MFEATDEQKVTFVSFAKDHLERWNASRDRRCTRAGLSLWAFLKMCVFTVCVLCLHVFKAIMWHFGGKYFLISDVCRGLDSPSLLLHMSNITWLHMFVSHCGHLWGVAVFLCDHLCLLLITFVPVRVRFVSSWLLCVSLCSCLIDFATTASSNWGSGRCDLLGPLKAHSLNDPRYVMRARPGLS